MEGIIKIYWGTETSVRLKEYDDTRLIRQRKTVSMAPDFVSLRHEEKDAWEEEDEDEENFSNSALPYFNPRTHPLFRESIGELNKTTTDPFYDQLLDQEILQDVENENLLSYDPIQKWKTLQSLVDGRDDSSDNSTEFTGDEQEIVVGLKSAERLARSSSMTHEKNPLENKMTSQKRSSTLPSKLTVVRDDLDDLLQVERKIEDHEKVYHTVHSKLPLEGSEKDDNRDRTNNNVGPPVESQHTERSKSGRIFTVEKLKEDSSTTQSVSFKLGVYEERKWPVTEPSVKRTENKSEDEVRVRSRGPRALRRRHGKKMDKTKLRRRSSINGHWYDRDTSVFTPPKHTPMCVYTSSKINSSEVVTTLLDKYKIESEPGHYALYLVKETGETRLVQDTEFPLVLRVNMGPHEDISKLYLMDKNRTKEISGDVAQYLNFSKTELRSFLNMFYEEEEREADRIRTKYLVIRRRLQYALRLKQGQGQVFN